MGRGAVWRDFGSNLGLAAFWGARSMLAGAAIEFGWGWKGRSGGNPQDTVASIGLTHPNTIELSKTRFITLLAEKGEGLRVKGKRNS